jgi:cupin fold WbuC family metalloprotein
MKKVNLSENETMPGVFHASAWGQPIDENLIELLIENAKVNSDRKARLCLHPTSDELLQVTYLAFSSPYSDKVHKHPHRPEVVIPIHGLARHSTFDLKGRILNSQVLDGSNPVPNSTDSNSWHSLEVLSDSFVMIEIGTGPFLSTSTVYLQF